MKSYVDFPDDSCQCTHDRTRHYHAEEREAANPDARARLGCRDCDCEQFTEWDGITDTTEEASCRAQAQELYQEARYLEREAKRMEQYKRLDDDPIDDIRLRARDLRAKARPLAAEAFRLCKLRLPERFANEAS
jgi:hypothetical protein